MKRHSIVRKSAALLCLGLAFSRAALAHIGPPFPVLVDQPIPGYSVTVLTNPDVSQAIFIVALEPVSGSTPQPVAHIDVWVQPLDGHRAKATVPAARQWARGHLEYSANPDIDQIGPWQAGVDIHLANGTTYPFTVQVTATPPGIGPWGLIFFIFPFGLFGGLWFIALRRRSRARAAAVGAMVSTASGAAMNAAANMGNSPSS